jgi:alkanesulfonate monooxygenase SsuD/methylene tetrahydromethanopterin reductase-like flavin-dependent oxidoreductase (luciferase family)
MKVGLSLPQSTENGAVGHAWPDVARLARQAEDAGADSLWVADHFFYRDEKVEIGLPEAFTTLTAVAAITSRIQMGPLVACTSFRSAGMLANIASSIDAISNGRLILGLGCGWHEAEYRALDFPVDQRVGRFEEVVAAVRPLLVGERVTVDGRWTKLEDAVIVPPPAHKVPMLIASNGPRMLDITARFADAWQGAWYGAAVEEYRTERAALQEACEKAGRTAPIEIFAGVDVNDDRDDSPHLPIDAGAIAESLAAWSREGVDHLELRVHPGTEATFAVALEGIERFRG